MGELISSVILLVFVIYSAELAFEKLEFKNGQEASHGALQSNLRG